MRLAAAFAIALVACSNALGQERVSVVDNSRDMEIRDAVTAAATAFSSEDVASYGMCFKESRRPQIRKQSALLFASNKCSMEIVEVHVIESDGSKASAAVNYNISNGSGFGEVVSEVALVREGGRWVIDKEKVVSKSDSRAGGRSFAEARPQVGPKLDFGPKFDLGPAARGPRGADGWDDYRPDPTRISPNLHHLMGDIGVREGMGCANGRCVNGRCEQR